MLHLLLQGRAALDKQAQLIAAAIQTAFVVQLGGDTGHAHWGNCLAVLADAELASIRSALGNALAQASQDRGLRAVGVVAYHEVCITLPSTKCLSTSVHGTAAHGTTSVP